MSIFFIAKYYIILKSMFNLLIKVRSIELLTSCKLLAKLLATFDEKNESVERIPHSLGTSVTRP